MMRENIEHYTPREGLRNMITKKIKTLRNMLIARDRQSG
jgi:hypothetical protein